MRKGKRRKKKRGQGKRREGKKRGKIEKKERRKERQKKSQPSYLCLVAFLCTSLAGNFRVEIQGTDNHHHIHRSVDQTILFSPML